MSKEQGENREFEEQKFKPGESGNPDGRPEGVKDRSTVIQSIIETDITTPEELERWMDKWEGHIPKKLSMEDLMVWMQVIKAIKEKDTKAYKALMEGRYGKPGQSIDQKVEHKVGVLDALKESEADADTENKE